MGGCRCVYRSCQSSTSVTPGLHYFHFPVKDKSRCDQWIANAQKPELHKLTKEKLRNKDRLVHNAIPTLGHEDEPLCGPYPNEEHQHVELIAMDEENTQFSLPDVEFAGKSYMIYNDSVVPSVREPAAKPTAAKKHFHVVLKTKTAAPVVAGRNFSPQPSKNSEVTADDIVFKKTNESGQIHAELKFENHEDDSIPSYSMSELNGDLSLKLTDSIEQPMIIDEESEARVEHTFTLELPQPAPLQKQAEPNSPQLRPRNTQRSQPTQQKHSARPQPTQRAQPTQKEIYDIVKPWKEPEQEIEEIVIPRHEKQIQLEVTQVVKPKYKKLQQQEIIKPQNEEQYIQMIQTNTKQIKTLKRLVHKQSKVNRFILQRKQMPNFKPKKLKKTMLLESLKDHLKPSLLAILKLELLPVEEVVLTDSEEKFIMDLYMEHPECYDLLRNKFNWNLPSNEVIAEANDHDQ